MQPVPPDLEPVQPLGVRSSSIPTIAAGGKTYGRILKSSAVIGGSSIVNIAAGIVRTKAMALFLGPAGVGLMGLYLSVLNLAQSIAGMGINTSGVRQIAEAAGSADETSIGRTAAVLGRTAFLLGLLGAALLAVFARPISMLTFGNDSHSVAISWLSLAVFFLAVSAGQAALIQGMRRIGDLARMAIITGGCGTLITIVLIYRFRQQGIVPSIICGAGLTILISWWFRRKVEIGMVPVTRSEWRREISALLKLGVAFSASAILTTVAAYAIRLIVLRKVNVEAAGLYQSAWTIGGLYAGFILQAMVTDFYPRLSAVASNNRECNRLVNEQAEISLLLAGPGVVATMTLAPLVISLFYTSRFAGAVDPLRWICLGMALRIVAWPVGFIIVAKGIQTIFFWTEVAATIVHIGLAFLLVPLFGVSGAAMAFAGLYIWHGVLIYLIARRISGFEWSALSLRCMLLFLPVTVFVFVLFHWVPFGIATMIGLVTTIGTAIYSLRLLLRLISLDRVPHLVRQLLVVLRVMPNGQMGSIGAS